MERDELDDLDGDESEIPKPPAMGPRFCEACGVRLNYLNAGQVCFPCKDGVNRLPRIRKQEAGRLEGRAKPASLNA